MRALVLATTILVAAGCSQRVTPEDEYAARETARAAPPGDIAVTIEAPDGDDALTPGGVLFVFVRAAGASGGPPLAVKRVPSPSFPVEIGIGPADAMIPGTTFPERVTVEARLDLDGDASTTGPADRVARSEPVEPPGGVRLVLEARGAP